MTPNDHLLSMSALISHAARRAMRKARAEHVAGRLSLEKFNRAVADYDATVEHAAQMAEAAIHHSAASLTELTTAVAASTDRIKQDVQRIDHASDTLKILGSILAFAAAIVLAVATPALIPGVVAAGASLATTLHDSAASDE